MSRNISNPKGLSQVQLVVALLLVSIMVLGLMIIYQVLGKA